MNRTGSQEELQIAREFATGQRLAVLSTVSPANEPESALMGVAVTPDFEIVFDTVRTSRKYGNLVANPRVAFVIGCTGETTVQYEGVAEELSGEALSRCLPDLLRGFPGWTGTAKLAGDHVFCGAAEVDALLQLWTAATSDLGVRVVGKMGE